MVEQEPFVFGQAAIAIKPFKCCHPAPLMRGQMPAVDFLLNGKPGFVGQSKTDRVRVIGLALSHVITPSKVLSDSRVRRKRMFALQTANRDL